jgi:hypothetical protein
MASLDLATCGKLGKAPLRIRSLVSSTHMTTTTRPPALDALEPDPQGATGQIVEIQLPRHRPQNHKAPRLRTIPANDRIIPNRQHPTDYNREFARRVNREFYKCMCPIGLTQGKLILIGRSNRPEYHHIMHRDHNGLHAIIAVDRHYHSKYHSLPANSQDKADIDQAFAAYMQHVLENMEHYTVALNPLLQVLA